VVVAVVAPALQPAATHAVTFLLLLLIIITTIGDPDYPTTTQGGQLVLLHGLLFSLIFSLSSGRYQMDSESLIRR
jgi:hypothetical protein